MEFKIEHLVFTEMLKNLLESPECINGIVFENLTLEGLNMEDTINLFFEFIQNRNLDFMILEIGSNKKSLHSNILENSSEKISKKTIKDENYIEKIFGVLERINIGKRVRELIQEKINFVDESIQTIEEDREFENYKDVLWKILNKIKNTRSTEEDKTSVSKFMLGNEDSLGLINLNKSEMKLMNGDLSNWKTIIMEGNLLKTSLMALSEVPFRKMLDITEIGIPGPKYYRIYKR